MKNTLIMENIHDWINSAVLIIFGVLYFMQDRTLKYMKTAMDAIDPDKILKSQKIIDEGKEYEYKLKMTVKSKEIITEAAKKFQYENKELISKYEELIAFPFSVLCEKSIVERENMLKYYPKNAETLRLFLKAYDNKEFPPDKSSPVDKNVS